MRNCRKFVCPEFQPQFRNLLPEISLVHDINPIMGYCLQVHEKFTEFCNDCKNCCSVVFMVVDD